ncbi:endonuclease [Flavobacteriaceae bacterium AU392]|nr:endonuclease [Flavobacteriaceae bacterium]RKM84988.1 endonuclease [Flavobacteriaceae bacterium AU392]
MASNYHTIAFYNIENLFDTFNDKYTHDEDFLSHSEKQWTSKRYKKKLRKIGYAISKIGSKNSKTLPAMVGLAEVENEMVVEDLINSKFLKDKNYDLVHYDSSDERGIDVALIYDTTRFEVTYSEAFPVELFDEEGQPDYTRDILLVEGILNNEKINVIVNHWSSRREGVELSEPKRLIASAKVGEIITQLREKDINTSIIIMGDFNDNPTDKSIKQLVNAHDLYNPMEGLLSYNKGSLNHDFKWYLFDQILFSTNFFEHQPGTHSFSNANVFDADFLKQFKGKYKGNPFRTYVWKFYKGGYSDHFPVYIRLKKN